MANVIKNKNFEVNFLDTKKFKNYSFKNIQYKDISFKDVEFTESSFQDAVFINCTFNQIVFEATNFNVVKFNNCSFNDVIFEKVIFKESEFNQLKDINSLYYKCHFESSIINESSFKNIEQSQNKYVDVDIKKSRYIDSYMDHINFSKITFMQISFIKVEFDYNIYNSCKFSECSYEKVKMYHQTGLSDDIINKIIEGGGKTQTIFQTKIFKKIVLVINIFFIFIFSLSLLIYVSPFFKFQKNILKESYSLISQGWIKEGVEVLSVIRSKKEKKRNFQNIFECKLNDQSMEHLQQLERSINHDQKKGNTALYKWYNRVYFISLLNYMNKTFFMSFKSPDDNIKVVNFIKKRFNSITNSNLVAEIALKLGPLFVSNHGYLFARAAYWAAIDKNISNTERLKELVFEIVALEKQFFLYCYENDIGRLLLLLKRKIKHNINPSVDIYLIILDLYDFLDDKDRVEAYIKDLCFESDKLSKLLKDDKKIVLKECLDYSIQYQLNNIKLLLEIKLKNV